jgi:hypothetical protein
MYDELRNCSLANTSQLSETFDDVHIGNVHNVRHLNLFD